MPDTLEKQLKKEILKRKQQSKQQQSNPKKRKVLILIAALGAISFALSLGQWYVRQSAPTLPDSPTPNGSATETI